MKAVKNGNMSTRDAHSESPQCNDEKIKVSTSAPAMVTEPPIHLLHNAEITFASKTFLRLHDCAQAQWCVWRLAFSLACNSNARVSDSLAPETEVHSYRRRTRSMPQGDASPTCPNAIIATVPRESFQKDSELIGFRAALRIRSNLIIYNGTVTLQSRICK